MKDWTVLTSLSEYVLELDEERRRMKAKMTSDILSMPDMLELLINLRRLAVVVRDRIRAFPRSESVHMAPVRSGCRKMAEDRAHWVSESCVGWVEKWRRG
jgi:hypothetical protein